MSDVFWRNDFVEQHTVRHPRQLSSGNPQPRYPSVLVAIIVRNGESFLKFYLECLVNQKYPKDKIKIYIRTNNNTDRTSEIIKAWVGRFRDQYAYVEVDDGDLKVDLQRYRQHEWNRERLQIIGELRNESLLRAAQIGCEYYFTFDVDTFIIDTTLWELVSLNLPIVAPFLRNENPNSLWSNYFSDIDQNGFHVSTPKYHAILSRLIEGIIEVPLVHCAYLIRSDVLKCVSYTSPHGGYEFMNFADSARRSGFLQYLDNRQLYGYNITMDPNEPSAATTVRRLEGFIRQSRVP